MKYGLAILQNFRKRLKRLKSLFYILATTPFPIPNLLQNYFLSILLEFRQLIYFLQNFDNLYYIANVKQSRNYLVF